MNALALMALVLTVFAAGYLWYGRRVAALWEPDPSRTTPAVASYDGVDYVPARNGAVLFGHHFASIAGAGPIVGPVIAVMMWGWIPALLWIVFGAIFLGGIHDFGSLMVSVREGGRSIGEVAATAVSRRAKLTLSVFVWLALILVIAVFAYLGADTFVRQPEVVLPSLGAIPLAMVVGRALYARKMPPVPVTVLGLITLVGLVAAGKAWPITAGVRAMSFWTGLLLAYCYGASILPVNWLLQPRDYLASFLLAAGILLALAGIVVSHPPMQAPGFIAGRASIGYLWPMMFITIACGANSGFHSLIASGTTAKQLPNERLALRIGFGGMLLEGVLAAIVVILVTAGLSDAEFQAQGTSAMSPVAVFGLGFGRMTSPFLGDWGGFIAITILNVFILTTLDSATRITRYITEEVTGLRNRWVSTAIVVLCAGWLALAKDDAANPLWRKIWPAFGAANQLVAALALQVIACWLLRKGKPSGYALIPALFMLGTSVTALGFQIVDYGRKGEFLLLGVAAVLIAAASILGWEVVRVFRAPAVGRKAGRGG